MLQCHAVFITKLYRLRVLGNFPQNCHLRRLPDNIPKVSAEETVAIYTTIVSLSSSVFKPKYDTLKYSVSYFIMKNKIRYTEVVGIVSLIRCRFRFVLRLNDAIDLMQTNDAVIG